MPSEPQSTPQTNVNLRLCLFGILLVACLLRIERLGLMAFEMDEGAACIFARRFVTQGIQTGRWPLIGIKTSLQFYNTPLFIYLISPAFVFTSDARLAALLFALLGTVAVYFVYRTGREFFSPAVGLWAAGLMAVSPAAVEYSRRLWGHSLIQILCPIAFYFTMQWIVGKRARAVFWLALIAGVAQQVHFSGALLWVYFVMAFVLFRPKTNWPFFALGLLLGLLGYVPFLYYEFDHDFESLRIIWTAMTTGASEAQRFDLNTVAYWFFAVTDFGHNNFLQHDYAAWLKRIPLYTITRAALGAAWVAALVACGVRAARALRGAGKWRRLKEGDGTRPILILIWSLVPLFVFLILRVKVVAPYLLLVYPAVFLAIAWAGVELWNWLESRGHAKSGARAAQGIVVVLFVAWGVHQVAAQLVLRHQLARDGGGSGSYATYRTQREATRLIALHAPGAPAVVTVDDRPPTSGIDIRHWYLLWTFEKNMGRFFAASRPDLRYWYVIRNRNYQPRAPGFDEFLAKYPHRDVGILRIYMIPRPGPWPQFAQ